MIEKKPRLIQESMPFETLALEHICSEDEVPISQTREFNELRTQQKLMKNAKFLRAQIKDLKFLSMTGMKSILEALELVDRNAMKITYKQFIK